MWKALASKWFPNGAAHCLELSAAFLVLVLGALVYVLDRPANAIPFLRPFDLGYRFGSIFGPIGSSLPTFAHAFSFSVFTVVWLGSSARARLAACLAWLAIDTAFEVGQFPLLAEHVVQLLPKWLEGLPVLKQAEGYFLAGTFDPWDLVSIALGTLVACRLTAYAMPKEAQYG